MGEMYFYDSYALIEIFKGNLNYQKFGECTIYASIMNFYEVYYSILKEFNEKTAEEWKTQIDFVLVEITKEYVVEASKFRLKNIKEKLSYIDCVGYIVAKRNKLKFLTGDEKFANKENVEFVK